MLPIIYFNSFRVSSYLFK